MKILRVLSALTLLLLPLVACDRTPEAGAMGDDGEPRHADRNVLARIMHRLRAGGLRHGSSGVYGGRRTR